MLVRRHRSPEARNGRRSASLGRPRGARDAAAAASSRRWRRAVAVAVGGGGSSATSGSTLTVADVAPFTGPDAALGPTYLVSCDAATNAINNAGGVLGHKFGCKGVDTRGDPADAVPAVRQMYASTSNLGAGHRLHVRRGRLGRADLRAPTRRCRSA